jgi:predicted nucleotidyltransferase
MATNFRKLLESLLSNNVEFVIVGGVAMVLQGSPRTTLDLDICYSRTPDNLIRLSQALAPYEANLRGAPRDLPFHLDAATLQSGLNFTLQTSIGDIDLLGEIMGIGRYPEVVANTTAMDLYGQRVLVMSLDGLERTKRAAGRIKDLADLAEILEIRKRRSQGIGN